MAAPHALIQVLTGSPATTSAAAAAALLTLAGAAVQVMVVAPRLPPRAAGVIALTEAVIVLAASWGLLAWAGLWWPAWPAVVALAFGQLGAVASRRPGDHRLPVARSVIAETARPGAPESRPPSVPRTEPPPDRATLGRYR